MRCPASGIRKKVSHALLLASFLLTRHISCQLPFAIGERLTYSVHAGPGMNGAGAMWIDGPVDVRGVTVMALHSEVSGGLGPFKASNTSTSWFDGERVASLRFTKSEKSPFSRGAEDVVIDASARTWTAADGRSGATASDQPLDELSFVYVLRTLDAPPDSNLILNRHYDAGRNPTRIRFLGTGRLKAAGAVWATREIEMRVRDERHYRGEGVIHISLSDDPCRRPLRIESTMPNAGKVVMVLESASPAISACSPITTTDSR